MVKILEDDIMFFVGFDLFFVMVYEFDIDKDFVVIDFEIKLGFVIDGKVLGIIKVDDGKFFFCYDLFGVKWFEEFVFNVENGVFMFVFKCFDD